MAYPVKQALFMPVGGLHTDIDDKLLPVGYVTDLENCYPVRSGAQEGTFEAIKRPGTLVMPALGGAPWQLGTHQGALINAGVPLKTLATPTDTTWRTAAGDFRPGISYALTKVASNALTPQMAIGGGYYWIVYSDAGTTLHAEARDTATGHLAFSNTFAAAGWLSWRVAYVNDRAVFVMVTSAGTIFYDVVVTSTMAETLTSSVTVANVATTDSNFDAFTRGTVVAVAFRKAGSNSIGCIDFDPVTSGKTAWELTDATAAAVPINNGALSWKRDYGASGKLALITASPAQGLNVQWDIPTTGATRQAANTYAMDAGFTVNSGYVAGHTLNATGDFLLVYENPVTRVINSASRIAGVPLTSLLVRRAALRSRTWQVGADGFVVVGTPSATTGAHYVLRILPTPVSAQTATPLATIDPGATNNVHGISAVAQLSATQFAVGLNYNVRLVRDNNPEAYGVQYATITHQALPAAPLGRPREALDSTFTPGGQLGQYDGNLFAEAGFAYPPDTFVSPTPSVGGGLTASSTYWYQLVYSYMDAQGRLWRSGPSLAVSGATGAGDGTLTLACPTLRITGRAAPIIQIEVYRGVAGDEIDFHKAGVVANDPTVDSVTFVDTMSDAALSDKEDLYTNGGILENDTPPGFVSIVQAQNRMWGISADDPQALWPSQEFTLHGGLGWSEQIAFDVRDSHGPMRALAVLDDRPVVFKDDMVYVVGGQGPDAAGNGGSYQATAVGQGIGCDNPQSICETRDGVIFRSTSQRAGFFLLDRGGSIQYIGAAVQRYNSETIVSSCFAWSLLQARFFTTSGRTLMYDLVSGSWSTFTGQPCSAAVSWAGVATRLSSATGRVLYEDLARSVLTDDGVPTTMLVGFAWLQVAGVRGYERFWRFRPVGEVSQGSVKLALKLYAEFKTAVPLTSQTVLAPVGVTVDGDDLELRFSAKLGAVRVVVTDGGATSGVLRLSGVSLIVGVKPSALRPTGSANRTT